MKVITIKLRLMISFAEKEVGTVGRGHEGIFQGPKMFYILT